MAFRPSRQKRKQDLLRRGFLPFEAQALSQFKRTVKGEKTRWLAGMYEARRKLVTISKREAWSKAKFAREVRDLYKDNDWIVKPTATMRTRSVGSLDPFAMARHYRQEWINRGDPYAIARRKKKKPPGERTLNDQAVANGREKIANGKRQKRHESELEKYDRGRGR